MEHDGMIVIASRIPPRRLEAYRPEAQGMVVGRLGAAASAHAAVQYLGTASPSKEATWHGSCCRSEAKLVHFGEAVDAVAFEPLGRMAPETMDLLWK